MNIWQFLLGTWLDGIYNISLLLIGIIGCSLIVRDVARKLRKKGMVYRVKR